MQQFSNGGLVGEIIATVKILLKFFSRTTGPISTNLGKKTF